MQVTHSIVLLSFKFEIHYYAISPELNVSVDSGTGYYTESTEVDRLY